MENILEQIKTLDDRDILLEEVDTLLSSLYHNGNETFDSVVKAKVRIWSANSIQKGIAESGLEKEDFLKKLKDEVNKMNKIRLVLAFDPPYSSIEVISNFIKNKFGKGLLIDFKFDPEIIAGSKIIYNGKYKDFSVASNLEKTLENLHKNSDLNSAVQ